MKKQQRVSSFPVRPLVAALLLAALAAHAAHAAPPGAPDAGTILQQVQPALPPAPSANQPGLEVHQPDAARLPASPPVAIATIRIVGNTAFPTDVLHALVAEGEGRSLTLPQLQELAARITAYYQAHDFPLSRAIIPAQKIAGGTVTIQVLEARYGSVSLDNASQVKDALLAATLAQLQAGQAIVGSDLDRALLLLSDVPGVTVNAVLKPGSEVGTSDLDVVTGARAATTGSVTLDNYGNRYIGRARLSGAMDVANPFHHGDLFSAGVVTTGDGMRYGRLGYETLLDGAGTRAGASYAAVHYELGDDLDALDAHGTAGVASVWIKRPVVRTRAWNVYGQLEYDDKRLRDHVDVTSTRTDRNLGDWILTVNGDARDDVLGGGASIWSVAWTSGHTRFEDALAEAADAASAQTRGGFSKWNINASRIQNLAARDTLNLNAAAQWSDANLDSAEKMTIGGPYTVRAYDIGAVSSDVGYFASVELRHDFGAFASGRWQGLAFVDGAHVRIDRHPWVASDNTANLSGAGVGVIWNGPGAWSANLTVARRIGNVPSVLGTAASVRAWLVAGKAF